MKINFLIFLDYEIHKFFFKKLNYFNVPSLLILNFFINSYIKNLKIIYFKKNINIIKYICCLIFFYNLIIAKNKKQTRFFL